VFGTANLDIHPFSQRVRLQAGKGLNFLSGDAGRRDAKEIDLHLNLADLPVTDGRLQGLRGELTAQISQMTYDSTGCLSATGEASTDVLQRNGGSIEWTGPRLEGPISCENGVFIADLSGRDAQQTVSARVQLASDGTYRADITARTNRPEADAVLPLFGFTRSGRDFKLTEQGKWR